MIPIVDARSGKVIRVGEVVPGDAGPFRIERVRVGLFSATASVARGRSVANVRMPIKWFPKLIYGKGFPTSGRTAIFPS